MPRIEAATVAEHRAQTRQRILDAFARLTRERGIDEVSLAGVAATAGIARSAIYNYFPDKSALLLAFTTQVTERFLSVYESRLPPGATPVDRIAVFIRVQLEGLTAHPHPMAGELAATLSPTAYQELADHVAPMASVLRDVIAGSGLATDPGGPEACADLILACVGAQRMPLLRGERTLDEACALVAAFSLRALGASEDAVRLALRLSP